MTTNAQAALAAAAALWGASEQTVIECASVFKKWLDRADKLDRAAEATNWPPHLHVD